MIMNMKKYVNPMLQIVSINKNDIIVTSETLGYQGNLGTGEGFNFAAPDRFRDWDAGY